MDFKTLIFKRFSLRSYSKTAVEKEKLEQLLQAARYAPSAVNFQPYRIYVVQTETMQEKIKSCYHREWLADAPLVLVMVGLHSVAWKRSYDMKDFTDVDCAIAVEHIALQASELGLGSCWICNFDKEQCSKVLDLKPDEEPIALLAVGYPKDLAVPEKKRKDLSDLVVYC